MPVCPTLVPFDRRRFTRATARALVMPDGLSSSSAPEKLGGAMLGAPVLVEVRDAL